MRWIQEFDAKHGPEYVVWDHWVLFADGAKRENVSYGMSAEPHSDPHQRAKDILMFHKVRLQVAVQAFDELKRELVTAAKYAQNERLVPLPPPSEALKELQRLKAQVEEYRQSVEDAEQVVVDTTPEAVLQRRAQNEERRAANSAYLADVQGINV
ncbi:MAG: hypothetical protein ACOC95_06655 [Planctomycetota bacterium]